MFACSCCCVRSHARSMKQTGISRRCVRTLHSEDGVVRCDGWERTTGDATRHPSRPHTRVQLYPPLQSLFMNYQIYLCKTFRLASQTAVSEPLRYTSMTGCILTLRCLSCQRVTKTHTLLVVLSNPIKHSSSPRIDRS